MPGNLTDQALFRVRHSYDDSEDLDEAEANDAVELYHVPASLARTRKQTASAVRAASSVKRAKLNSDKEPDVVSDKHKNTCSLEILALAASTTPTQTNTTGTNFLETTTLKF